MSDSAVALSIISGVVLAGAMLGFLAGAHQKMNLERWTTGGRGFGTVFMYLLMAGEVYTTFSFLGASGWVYSRGGPALYILGYLTLAYVVSYFTLPYVWELGQRHGLQTEADFFACRYGAKMLPAFVALVGVAFIVPYLQLQLIGLGIIVEVASSSGIGRTPAMIVSVALIVAFVLASGLRAVAWMSVLKDALMLAAAISIGIMVPRIYFGGFGPMFAALAQAKPAHLTMPGATANLGHAWYLTTVLTNAVGFYMWPHSFASAYAAKSGETLRRNSVFMPLYNVTLVLVFCVGAAALLVVPGLKDPDLAMLVMVRRSFPAWFLGLAGGAGALTAIVPASVFILTSATLFAKNLCRPIFAPAMTDDQVARLAKGIVALLGAVSLYFAIYRATSLVSLLLLGYAGVTQFFPGVVLGLYWKRANAAGVFAGLAVGVGLVALLAATGHDPLWGMNAGFVALCVNFAVTVGASLISRFGE